MTANPSLKVFAACGYYDLATPHFAMDYTLDHLGLAKPLLPNITKKYYEGGHMMYIHEPSMVQLRADLLQFYSGAVPQKP
jgi:carboxypeptidase C (cathepsin A)